MRAANYLQCALLTAALAACSDSNRWHVEGTLANSEPGTNLVLESSNYLGQWYPIDTIAVSSNGAFRVSHPVAGYPEVYRLTLGDESLYFPIDSTETINIAADAKGISHSYTLSGSDEADRMQQLNDMIAKVIADQGEQAITYDPELRRNLANYILANPSGIAAYYTIFRRVGDTPLFNPADRADLRMIGAVANAFSSKRPDDPRTPYLAQYYLQGRRNAGYKIQADTIVATEMQLPEIELLDRNGVSRSLTEAASKGNVVILNFTGYTAEWSPSLNLELAKIYRENKSKGLEIYQIAFDEDEFDWRTAAANVPWISVYGAPKERGKVLLNYNVGALPVSFVINRDGELVERVEDVTKLESTVTRYL
ncbi:MAG: AhpC/TSA family protein [Bacteroides sp.]|nr:AhpC/TSA family protein [Bacteroides sp.]